ncbi:hypothetical protein Hden_1206 [Hyphomicrobium denitrificans ATCC 51888]|uniref:Uncharacterized protein n=1 Tax=Hyphomicrobium denitrificans (strain ATCC 51888 / DSM 1869 / NCIMB 11706 / TK 0415) TaxID=582899 RepID=D8JWA5_HYPDA|nr:hypothetical protein [Hyphomicrobium denitrificans]ADJ23018.1 hypothetical protein Hden_1206 [Hyphomicrobium denitrificans ATCC 51888]
MEIETSIRWTSKEAKAHYDEIQRKITERGNEIFGGQYIAHMSGQYQELQKRFLDETAVLRQQAVDLYAKFTTPEMTVRKE